jgi:hypothetical protein
MIHIFNSETQTFILFGAFHAKVEPGPAKINTPKHLPEATILKVGQGVR